MITLLLHVSAKTLLVVWAIGFFLFNVGTGIHFMLILALLFLVFRYMILSKSNESNRANKYGQIIENTP